MEENDELLQTPEQPEFTPPTLPKAWTDLTWEQLLYTWQMLGSERPLHEAYLDIFQHFMHCHLDTEDMGIDEDTGQPLYYFIYEKQEGVRFTLTPADLYITCQEELKWMQEDPYCLIELPQDGFDRGDLLFPGPPDKDGKPTHIRFHVPEALINSMTYQQYQVCQQYMQAMTDEPDYRYGFISHCLTPCTGQKTTSTGQTLYDYKYEPSVAEANIPFFREHPMEGLCEALLQLIQSSLKKYKDEFPHLFSSSGGGGGSDKSPFITEISTINSVAKWSNMFGDPEKVLEANVPIIFDILDKMQDEAQQIESMNQRMKSRRH